MKQCTVQRFKDYVLLHLWNSVIQEDCFSQIVWSGVSWTNYSWTGTFRKTFKITHFHTFTTRKSNLQGRLRAKWRITVSRDDYWSKEYGKLTPKQIYEDAYKQGNPWYPVCSCKYTPAESQTSHYFLAIFMCIFVFKGEAGWSTAQSVLREMQEKMDKVLITMMFLTCHYSRVIYKLDVSTWKLDIFFWTDFQVWSVQINSCIGSIGRLNLCCWSNNTTSQHCWHWRDTMGASVAILSATATSQESHWILAHTLVSL